MREIKTEVITDVIEKLCKIPVNVEIASEFRYSEPLINENTLTVFISQSGETADTLKALDAANETSKTLAIVNVRGSSACYCKREKQYYRQRK